MTKTANQIATEWLYYAKSDLQLARDAQRASLSHQVCFHAQQAVEKSLKAILAQNNQPIPKLHSISKLIKLLVNKIPNAAEWKEKANFLDKFYVPSRYPDALPGTLPEGLPHADDAKQSLEIAQDLYQLVLDITKLSPAEV